MRAITMLMCALAGDKFSHGDNFIKANFDYIMDQPAIDRLRQETSNQWESEGEE